MKPMDSAKPLVSKAQRLGRSPRSRFNRWGQIQQHLRAGWPTELEELVQRLYWMIFSSISPISLEPISPIHPWVQFELSDFIWLLVGYEFVHCSWANPRGKQLFQHPAKLRLAGGQTRDLVSQQHWSWNITVQYHESTCHDTGPGQRLDARYC